MVHIRAKFGDIAKEARNTTHVQNAAHDIRPRLKARQRPGRAFRASVGYPRPNERQARSYKLPPAALRPSFTDGIQECPPPRRVRRLRVQPNPHPSHPPPAPTSPRTTPPPPR